MGRIKKGKKLLYVVLMLVLFCIMSSGCGQAQETANGEKKQQVQNNTAKESEDAESETSEIAEIPEELIPGQNEGKTTENSSDDTESSAVISGQDVGNDASGQYEKGQESTQNPVESNEISVFISVESSNAGGSVSASGTVVLAKGATVYDALNALMGGNFSGSSDYISGIGGLSEKDYGPKSGWLYNVNGVYPGKGCGSYILEDGDAVEWKYTTNGGNDI